MAAGFETIMKRFLEHYAAQSEDVLVKEFMTLKSQSQKYKEINRYPADAGQLPTNRRKNRFKDILPFEYTRVELHPVEGVEGSDYINANYVLGASGEINYIAAQGPLPNTVDDFWRMLWYHNIEIVVMACREVEMGKHKCERYWPQVRQSMDVGAIKVTTVYEENVSNDFVIRDLMAECQGEKQTIRQYHYNAWPDHGKPDSPDPIIRMIEMMNSYRKQAEIPIVVHCSAGCGRTGTLIGIDIAKIMLLSKEVDPDFSVFKIVEKMRQQRPAMVQAKEQYLFVYMAIAELARRSIGLNPTVPPKPVAKPAATPTGKGYLNIDTNAPNTNNHASSSSTASSRNNSPPTPKADGGGEEDVHLYENVNRQPSLPTHKRNSTTEAPEVQPPEEPPKTQPPQPQQQPPPPTMAKRPAARQRSQVAPGGGEKNSSPTEEEKEKPSSSSSQPMPKPRPRNRNSKGESNSNSGPSPPGTMAKIAPPVAYRPTTPTKPLLPAKKSPPDIAARPSSPNMSRRPLPSTPDKTSPTSSGSSPMKSPSRRPNSDKLPELPSKQLPELPSKQPPELPSKQPPQMDLDSMYSLVDPALITDTGPEIVVVDEKSNTSVPLKKFEKEKKTPGSKGASKSSIMDTLMDVLGEDLMKNIDKNNADKPDSSSVTSRPLPSIPPDPSRERSDTQEEPPEVPQRTDARLELVGFAPVSNSSTVPSVNYEAPGEVAGSSSPPHSAAPASNTDVDYEEPTPLSIPVINKPPPFSSPVPQRAAVSATLPHHPNSSTSSLSPASTSTVSRGGSTKLGGFFKKSKRDKKKMSATEDSITNTLPVATISADRSSSKTVEEKYRFPGTLGFGVRLQRPIGPRDEPSHWKNVALPSTIRVS